MPSEKLKNDIVEWFVNGERGMSSEVMAATALRIKNNHNNFAPVDPADLNRCIKLLKAAPEIKMRFSDIANLSGRWKLIIDNWDKLVEMFVTEVGYDWCLAQRAPKTYKFMKDLGL